MQHYFSLTGRTALVTGGSRGIGRMIAQGYLEAGARVIICCRKIAEGQQTAEQLSQYGECIALAAPRESLGVRYTCPLARSTRAAAARTLKQKKI